MVRKLLDLHTGLLFRLSLNIHYKRKMCTFSTKNTEEGVKLKMERNDQPFLGLAYPSTVRQLIHCLEWKHLKTGHLLHISQGSRRQKLPNSERPNDTINAGAFTTFSVIPAFVPLYIHIPPRMFVLNVHSFPLIYFIVFITILATGGFMLSFSR